MAHDVFISYSTKNKTVADAVCVTLESQKIRCWIAPRDVPAGQPYAASLVKAIRASSVIVLILSQDSNQSIHVLREVGEAVDNGIPILPLRIEDVDPTEEMHYYIKSIHWLDAMSPPLERHLVKLTNSVQALLNVGEEPPLTGDNTAIEVPAQKPRRIPIWAITLLVFIALGILGGVGAWVLRQQKQAPLVISTENSPENDADPTIAVPSPSPDDAQWRTLGFIIPNETLWREEENSYTVISKPSSETSAWSDEIIEGNFILSAQVTRVQPGNVFFIVYGDGIGFSKGCLIFVFERIGCEIVKNSLYDGINLVSTNGDFGFQKASHDFTIEITEDTASFYVDGQKVAFTFLPSDINNSGRIGLWQNWEEPAGVTYSNIKIKTQGTGD